MDDGLVPVQSGLCYASRSSLRSESEVWSHPVQSNPVQSPFQCLVSSGPGRTKHQSYKRRHQSSPWCSFLVQNLDLLTCEQIANRHICSKHPPFAFTWLMRLVGVKCEATKSGSWQSLEIREKNATLLLAILVKQFESASLS